MNTYVVTIPQGNTSAAVVESVREFQAHYSGPDASSPTLIVDAPNSTEALRIALRKFTS